MSKKCKTGCEASKPIFPLVYVMIGRLRDAFFVFETLHKSNPARAGLEMYICDSRGISKKCKTGCEASKPIFPLVYVMIGR